ncbi:MAG: hypothetical protein ACRYFU_08730, partial [Janthinobacterium lividum]
MSTVSKFVRRFLRFFPTFPLAAAMVGCGVGNVTQSATGSFALTGHVHGGIQPVSGATVELYSVSTGGNGTAATNILTQSVTTDSKSFFSITGDYTCNSPDEQVYLVARGGNPGFTGTVNNHALVMLSALGRCTDLISNPNAYVWVNEVSTVAAVYALAPFMTAYNHVGASATNKVGIANAFLNAQLLANTADGQTAALAKNLSIEQAKLYSLADAIVPCVNSTGGNACTPLFTAATPAGGTAPTDVVGALLNIVQHPGSNVAAVFDLISPAPPFPAALTKPPSDWTMSLTVSGGGLYEPTGMGLDTSGNVWVANFGGPSANNTGQNPTGVVAYTPQGIPLSATPYAAGPMTEIYGLTLDVHGDVWITSEENVNHDGTYGSIAKIGGVSSGRQGALIGQFYDDSIDFPESIASDPSTGNIMVANYAGSTATYYDINGNYLNNVGAGSLVFPVDLISDGVGGSWLANQGEYTITHIPASGSPQVVHCCSEPNAVALDPQGNVWVTNFGLIGGNYTFSEVASNGTILMQDKTVPGLSTPGGAVVDAGGQFWVLNYHDGSFLGIAGNQNTLPAGSGLSPIALGKDANLVEPFRMVTDASGNLWVSNRAMNNVVMFFGLATPTVT